MTRLETRVVLMKYKNIVSQVEFMARFSSTDTWPIKIIKGVKATLPGGGDES